MTLIELLFFHSFVGISALQIEDENGVYPPGNITQMWFEDQNEEINFFVQLKSQNLEEADPDDLTIKKDEFERILDETAVFTFFDNKKNTELLKIPLKRKIKSHSTDVIILQSKEPLTKYPSFLNAGPEKEMRFKLSFKVSDKMTVEYNSYFLFKNEATEDGANLTIYKADDDEEKGITPIIKITKEEPEIIPESSVVEEFVPVKFWSTQAGVSFLVISSITLLFFVIPSIWKFYRIFFSK